MIYQLTQLLSEYSQNKINVPEGSLYPSLYQLEEKHYITSEKKLVGKRLSRVYYHIEPSGREYLNELLTDYYQLNKAIVQVIERGKSS